MSTQLNTNICTWHAHYVTSIQCANGDAFHAKLHIYSLINDVVHSENTVAFIYVRTHVDDNCTVFLNTSHVMPCLGDPDDDTYENHIPNFPHPFVVARGHISYISTDKPLG
jgi:hypothetical protein